jgi:aspartate kinase
MKAVILKFGGASLRDLEQFQKVADIIERKKKYYDQVVVVVSAMGTMTDELLGLAKQISENPPKRELDMLVSVGERISMTLLAMVLSERSLPAISFTGSQAGIITCGRHSDARVLDVKPKRILPHLEAGTVVVVAGFQGVSESGEVTTLGRGGSDTTAVALGAALNAEIIEFYKDVKGIFSNDPKKDYHAEYLPELTYEEALCVVEKSERKVLHPRAIELAKINRIPLFVGSFEKEGSGTLIRKKFEEGIPREVQKLGISRPEIPRFELGEADTEGAVYWILNKPEVNLKIGIYGDGKTNF